MKKEKLSRLEKKQKKLDKKKLKYNAKHDEAPKQKSVKKHITSMSLVGSRMITSVSSFAAAGTFYQYEIIHNSPVIVGAYGAATVVTSVLGAAPYVGSVRRTNKTLASAVASMDKLDAAIGSQKQSLSEALGIIHAKSDENMKSLHMKIDGIQKSIDAKKPEEASLSQVHVAPTQGKKNITVE